MTTPLRIAIADDDRSARTILRKAIEVLGHTVVIDADNGRDLIQQCLSEPPDVVITDNLMGDMTGLEAAAEIFRNHPLPIVLVSGFCDPAIVRAAENQHVLVYLVKPISPDHLQAALICCVNQLELLRKSDRSNEVYVESRNNPSVDDSRCNPRRSPREPSPGLSASSDTLG